MPLRIQLVEGDLLMVPGIAGWAVYSWMLARPPQNMRGTERPTGTGPSSLCPVPFGVVIGFGAAGLGEALAPSMTPNWNAGLIATIIFIAVGLFPVIAYRSGAGRRRGRPSNT